VSALGTQRIAKHTTTIPPSGGFYFDGILETGGLPAIGARLTLTIADLALVGTVVRAGFDVPDQPHVIVRGGAGWGTVLTRASYQSAQGVRLSTVLRGLIAIAKEPIDDPPDAIIGNAYSWPASTAMGPVRCGNVLADLVRRGSLSAWRVAPSGRTRFDAWPALPASDTFCRIVDRDLSVGVRFLGLADRAAAFLPGATVEGVTIRRVIFRETSSDLRAEAWDS